MDDQAIEQQIQAKGKTAARVTPADIEANIAGEHYFAAAEGTLGRIALEAHHEGETIEIDAGDLSDKKALNLLTFCVLVLRNGFTVTGESACASPENFDAEIGRNIARQNAVQKIWPLMGYALKQQLHLAAHEPPAPGAAHPGYNALLPHQQRVVDEERELDERLRKLHDFIGTPTFNGLPVAEQDRLGNQYVAMSSYARILAERIAAFAPAQPPVDNAYVAPGCEQFSEKDVADCSANHRQ